MDAHDSVKEALRARAAYVEAAEAVARGERAGGDLPALSAAAAAAELEARKAVLRETWTEVRPPAAPHVLGRFNRRTFDDDGMPEEQLVEAKCEHPGCGATFKRRCSSGLVQEHIARFATVHLHRDIFHVKPRKEPGT